MLSCTTCPRLDLRRTASRLTESKEGVPTPGYVLTETSDQPRSFKKDFKSTDQLATKDADWGYQLHGFPNTWEPLPVGATIMDIVKKYPNHLWDAFLDSLLQHRISSGTIWRLLNETKIYGVHHLSPPYDGSKGDPPAPIPTMADLFQVVGICKPKRGENFLTKRMDRRMDVLCNDFDPDEVRDYLDGNNHRVVRELGPGLQKGDSSIADVGKWLSKKAKQTKQESTGRADARTAPQTATHRKKPRIGHHQVRSQRLDNTPRARNGGSYSTTSEPEPKSPFSWKQGGDGASAAAVPDFEVIRARQSMLREPQRAAGLVVGWEDDDLHLIAKQAAIVGELMMDDILILLRSDRHYQSFLPGDLELRASEILQFLISKHYEHFYSKQVLRYAPSPTVGFISLQLEVEVGRLVGGMDLHADRLSVEEVEALKDQAKVELTRVYTTTGTFIASLVVRLLKGEEDDAIQSLTHERPCDDIVNCADRILKAVADLRRGRADTHQSTFSADLVASLLAMTGEKQVEADEGHVEDDVDWLKKMVKQMKKQQGLLHSVLEEDYALQEITDVKHIEILETLSGELRRLERLRRYNTRVADAVGENGGGYRRTKVIVRAAMRVTAHRKQ